jgi:hypothetical protein
MWAPPRFPSPTRTARRDAISQELPPIPDIRTVQDVSATIQNEALELLEWPRLCGQVATFAATPAGRRQVADLPLGATAAESQSLLGETTELLAPDGLTEGGLSFQGVADLGHAVALCAKRGTAGGEALLEVSSTLATARRLRRQIDDPARRPLTTALVADLRTLPELEQRLRFCLEEGGRVADRAKPALQGLRRQLAGVRAERRDRLQELLRRWAPMLQDTVIAERNGRPVLAVKAGAASQLAGLVHDSSASGSTVFLEPREVIPLGNRLRELEGQERELEQVVLLELSGLVGEEQEAWLGWGRCSCGWRQPWRGCATPPGAAGGAPNWRTIPWPPGCWRACAIPCSSGRSGGRRGRPRFRGGTIGRLHPAGPARSGAG